MTTNTHATTILCYGDSNTWGQQPANSQRYPVDVRWTGRLQDQLGDACDVIEEGLGSRTTDLEYAKKPGRNGKTYLLPCLQSHNPIDLVILMLGTNDLKIEFDRSPQDIAAAIAGLLDDIRRYATSPAAEPPQVLVVSPIHINDTAPDFAPKYGGVNYDAASATKSHSLGRAIQTVAHRAGAHFFDASTVSAAGSDGIHFTPQAHAALANALAHTVRDLLSNNERGQRLMHPSRP